MRVLLRRLHRRRHQQRHGPHRCSLSLGSRLRRFGGSTARGQLAGTHTDRDSYTHRTETENGHEGEQGPSPANCSCGTKSALGSTRVTYEEQGYVRGAYSRDTRGKNADAIFMTMKSFALPLYSRLNASSVVSYSGLG